MATNNRTTLEHEELPKFNGKRIKSISAVYENSRYATKGEGGGYIADILYYECNVHEWDYRDFYGKSTGPKVLEVKDLPTEFHNLFGMVENKGERSFITHIRFDTDSYGDTSDKSAIDLHGWHSNSTTAWLSYYRNADRYCVKDIERKNCFGNKQELGKACLSILKKSFKVKEVEFHEVGAKMEEGTLDFATKYPYEHTPIRIIDGLVYPDEKLSSWRWLHGMPYRVPSTELKEVTLGKETKMVPSKKHLRVWNAGLKSHLYLEHAGEVQAGDENLLFVEFSSKGHEIYGAESFAYCNIHQFNAECGYELCRHTILKVDGEHWNVEFQLYRGDKKIGKPRRTFQGMFYRLVRIVHTQETNLDKD